MRSTFTSILLLIAVVTASAQITRKTSISPDLKKLAAPGKVTAVKPLTRDAKLLRVKSLIGGQVTAKALSSSTLNQPVTLSVGSPVNGSGSLKFNLAGQVSPKENAAFFQKSQGNSESGVLVAFNAPSAGTYIFDFSTTTYEASSGSPVAFHFKGIFNLTDQQVSVAKDDGHLIFLTKDMTAGWNYMFLTGEKASWEFYSVDITQFKIGS